MDQGQQDVTLFQISHKHVGGQEIIKQYELLYNAAIPNQLAKCKTVSMTGALAKKHEAHAWGKQAADKFIHELIVGPPPEIHFPRNTHPHLRRCFPDRLCVINRFAENEVRALKLLRAFRGNGVQQIVIENKVLLHAQCNEPLCETAL